MTAIGDKTEISEIEMPAFGRVYYDVLAGLAANPDRRLSFTLNGETFENVGWSDLQDQIDQTLHHPLIRKLVHFHVVSLAQPPCF